MMAWKESQPGKWRESLSHVREGMRSADGQLFSRREAESGKVNRGCNRAKSGSCLKTGQHSIFVIAY